MIFEKDIYRLIVSVNNNFQRLTNAGGAAQSSICPCLMSRIIKASNKGN
jgi:hypothetical protein